jgi:hypothetical protein
MIFVSYFQDDKMTTDDHSNEHRIEIPIEITTFFEKVDVQDIAYWNLLLFVVSSVFAKNKWFFQRGLFVKRIVMRCSFDVISIYLQNLDVARAIRWMII